MFQETALPSQISGASKTIKSEEKNHLPASDGALWDIIPPEDFFNNPDKGGFFALTPLSSGGRGGGFQGRGRTSGAGFSTTPYWAALFGVLLPRRCGFPTEESVRRIIARWGSGRNCPQLPSFPKSPTAVSCARRGKAMSRAADGGDTRDARFSDGAEPRVGSKDGGFLPARRNGAGRTHLSRVRNGVLLASRADAAAGRQSRGHRGPLRRRFARPDRNRRLLAGRVRRLQGGAAHSWMQGGLRNENSSISRKFR